MNKKVKLPKLTAAPNPEDKGALRRWMNYVTHILQTREGQTNPLDRNVQLRDLQDLSVITGVTSSGALVPGSGVGSGGTTTTAPTYYQPAALTGLKVTSGYSFIFIEWTDPAYPFLAHYEIHRSASNDLGTATLLATTPSTIFADDVGSDAGPYYYWVRMVSTENDTGPFNAVDGEVGQTGITPQELLDKLNGQITETQLFADLNSRIDLIDTPTTGLVDSLAQEIADRAAAITAEASARAAAISAEASARAADILAVQNGYAAADATIQSQLDAVQVTANNAATGVSTNASAITGLDTRLTTAEGNVTSQASDITLLQTDLAAANVNIGANASALTLLDSRVTLAEGNISAAVGDITQLQLDVSGITTDLNGAEADILVNTSAISAINTTLSQHGTDITATSNRLDQLEVALSNPVVIFYQAAEPTDAGEGDFWIDSDDSNKLYIYENAAFHDIIRATTEPTWVDGDYWIDTDDSDALYQRVSGTATLVSGITPAPLLTAAITAYVQAAEPSTPIEGDIWVETDNNDTCKIYIGGVWVVADGSRFSTFQGALDSLESRVTIAEGTITTQGTSITNLQGSLTTANGNITTNANAISTLQTDISNANGAIAVNTSDITTLDSRLTIAEGDIDASATAITGLNANVSSLQGITTAQSSDITQLQSNMTAAEADLVLKGSAIDALTTRVTDAEDDILVNVSGINALNSTLGTLDGTVSAQGTAINSLQTTVSNIDDVVTSHTSDISSLQSSISNANSAIEANALALSTTQATVTQQGNDISAVSGTVTQHAIQIEQEGRERYLSKDRYFNDAANNWVVKDAFSGVSSAEVLAGAVTGVAPTLNVGGGFAGGNSLVINTAANPLTVFYKHIMDVKEGDTFSIQMRFKITTPPATGNTTNSTLMAWAYNASGTSVQTFANASLDVVSDGSENLQTLEVTIPASAVYFAFRAVISESGADPVDVSVGEIISLGVFKDPVVEELTAAIETESSIRATQTGELYATNTVKVDANGYVAGYGLAVDGNLYDENWHSTMLFNVDTFAIGSPGASNLSFVVDNGQVVMDAAYITNLTVSDAQIANVSVDKIIGDTASFVSANIGDASITDAKIGQIIQSSNYVPGVSGWHLNKDGQFFAQNATISGTISGAIINGSEINGGIIRGAVIASDNDLTVPTEANGPGQYDYLGYARQLTTTKSIAWSGYIPSGSSWIVSPAVDIYSANYSVMTVYRRYVAYNITPTVIISNSGTFQDRFLTESFLSGTVTVEIRQGSTLRATAAVNVPFIYGDNTGSASYGWGNLQYSYSISEIDLGDNVYEWRINSMVLTFNFNPFQYAGDSLYYCRVKKSTNLDQSVNITLTDTADNV